ncbi:hypothetical protein D4R99_04505 [bacterium]|nr:MAG: hypothetical protein D4R99_04505 [bacterium]
MHTGVRFSVPAQGTKTAVCHMADCGLCVYVLPLFQYYFFLKNEKKMIFALVILFIGWLGFVFAVGGLITAIHKRFFNPEGMVKSTFRTLLITFGFTLWYFFVFILFPALITLLSASPAVTETFI